MDTQDLVAERLTGLGGSDAAAIFGLSPWKSALDVYLEKTGAVPPEDISSKPAVKHGADLEAVVASWYAEETGERVRRVNKTLRHPKYPFIIGHIDRDIVGKPKLLEVKCAGARAAAQWGPSGSQELPEHYRFQVMHYIAVKDYDAADLAAFLGVGDLRIYTIERDNEMIEAMIETLSEFWARIQERRPPEPQSLSDVAKLYPLATAEKSVVADAERAGFLNDIRVVREEIDALEAHESELKKWLQAFMGDAEVLLGPDGKKLAQWKNETRSRFDSASFKEKHPELHAAFTSASTSRVFRLIGGKK